MIKKKVKILGRVGERLFDFSFRNFVAYLLI